MKKTEIYLHFAKNGGREHDREHSHNTYKRKRMYYLNLKGSLWHRKINEKKEQDGKLSYVQIKGSIKFGSMVNKTKGITSFDKSVSKFKALIKSAPVFVFVVCNRCHY